MTLVQLIFKNAIRGTVTLFSVTELRIAGLKTMIFRSLIKQMKTAISRSLDYVIDSSLGIDAGGVLLQSQMRYEGTDFHPYHPVSWNGLRRIFETVPISCEDVFVDVGCGKGRPLIAALQKPFRKVIGIDLSPEMCQKARENVERFCTKHQIDPTRAEVIHTNALEYTFPPEVKCILIYCPFGESSTREFLRRLSDASPVGCVRHIIAINPCFMDSIYDSFDTTVVATWGGGWYRIFRVEKKA